MPDLRRAAFFRSRLHFQRNLATEKSAEECREDVKVDRQKNDKKRKLESADKRTGKSASAYQVGTDEKRKV